MKCDHLIGRTFDGIVYVEASEAMEAIAELKTDKRRLKRALCLLRFAFSKLEQNYISRFEYNESKWDEMWEKRADYWKAKAEEYK